MKKLSLFLGFLLIAIAFGSCGKEDVVTPPASEFIFEKDLVEFSGVQGEQHIYFKTTPKTKLSVAFTGETDAGTSNFQVNITAVSDTVNSLIPITIYSTF
ncbi:MAG: hypothetical protein EHM58_18025, partial [Ignavibacteriae bacterium]